VKRVELEDRGPGGAFSVHQAIFDLLREKGLSARRNQAIRKSFDAVWRIICSRYTSPWLAVATSTSQTEGPFALAPHFKSTMSECGKQVTCEQIERARGEGSTDKEIHDTALIAVCFRKRSPTEGSTASWDVRHSGGVRQLWYILGDFLAFSFLIVDLWGGFDAILPSIQEAVACLRRAPRIVHWRLVGVGAQPARPNSGIHEPGVPER
jgi:muconolactone delta-isomerase